MDSATTPVKRSTQSDHERLDLFKKKISKDAEELLFNKVPERIQQLAELLKRPEFNLAMNECHSEVNINRPGPAEPMEQSGDEPSTKRRRSDEPVGKKLCGTKVMVLPNGVVGINERISKIFELAKPVVQQQIDDCCLLKMWIELLIPKVEDGNNFGVDIQEECLKIVSSVEGEAVLYLDFPVRYYMARAKIVVQVAKYPYIEDYRRTIEELDEKHYLNMKLVVREISNNYASMHDMLMKNIEKIRTPRTTNADSLY